jgi:cytochrome oxidase Cu insertion factor (SCO1/SenC/PrrC family)
VVEIDGQAEPFNGYLDTVVVPERGVVKIRIAFTDPLIVGRFMYHCHVLDHEDKGMMAVIEVYDPKAISARGVTFRLLDQFGGKFTQEDLGTKPTLMFFGYDYCPDVCPVQLARMTGWLRALGPAASQVNVVYVTVDPERDTSSALKRYLAAFDPRIRGYSVDHSVQTYVLDAHRKLIGAFGMDESEAILLPKLKRLLRP